MARLFHLLAATAFLAACEARVGNEAGSGNASAEGKAEEGQLTIDTPGMELKINIPEGLRGRAQIDENSGIIYPGSSFSGIHVAGGSERPDGGREGEVELAFTTPDAPDRVVAWYRDPARSGDFTIGRAERRGEDFVLAGTTREDGDEFRLRLEPKRGGGTEARLLIRDRHEP